MPDATRLLARDSTRQHPHLGTGYTDEPGKALRDEPEAVSTADQHVLTARAHASARDEQRQEWTRRRTTIQREIDWLYSQRFAKDVGRSLRVLHRQLAHIDKLVAR